MSIYDDERVIALLHDAVPAVPEAPDRLAAVRHRAGRQRVRAWSQGIGVVAVVLLVIGVAATFGGGKREGVHPVRDPLRVMTDALLEQRTARFRVTAHATGPSDVLAAVEDTDLTGAVTRDGDIQVDGSLGALAVLIFGDPTSEVHARVVNGVGYWSGSMFHTDPAKEWVRSPGQQKYGVADVRRYLRLAAAIVDEPAYLGTRTIDGVEVAVYRAYIPAKYTHGQSVNVTFALDADGLPRRVDVDLPYAALIDEPSGDAARVRVAIGIDLYGYGDAVDIAAPTGVRFLDEVEYTERADAYNQEQSRKLRQCEKAAHSETAKQQCGARYPAQGYGGIVNETFVDSVQASAPPMPAVTSPSP